MLLDWIKKLHIYVGLVSLTVLVVFGLVGLSASFTHGRGQRDPVATEVRSVEYRAPAELSDRDLADHVFRALDLPLTRPPDDTVRRDRDHNLRFRLQTPAKVHTVVVLEDEGRVRLETSRVDAWAYLTRLHTMTLSHAGEDWRLRLWGLYVELSIASLLFLSCGGVCLWLGSRPRLRWAQWALAGGAVAFAALWVITRWR